MGQIIKFTDDQLETAARKLCDRRGVNPDTLVWRFTNGSYYATAVETWKVARDELVDTINKMEVLEEVFVEIEEELADA